jgi:hypothetical protein
MRILDNKQKTKLDFITVFLTQEEVVEMIGYLKGLMTDKGNSHVHMSTDDYKKEITLCKYNPDNLEGLNERSQLLIREDR